MIDNWLKPKGKELPPQIPLPVRLIGIRLDKIEKATGLNEAQIAEKEIRLLREQINQLPHNSVVIIEAASILNQIADDNYWTNLTPPKFEFLHAQIKPLFRTVSQVDFKAMRFSKDVLEVSLVRLGANAGNEQDQTRYDTLVQGIVEQISELPLAVPMVKRQEPLIKAAQQSHYWMDCTDSDLDVLAEALSPLMKFREQRDSGQGPVYLDLQDKVIQKESVEFGPQHESVSISRYKEMVEALILQLTADNPILQKVKDGQDISPEEAESLAELLHERHPHIIEELLQTVYRNRKACFIQFIRHILGIEILKSFPETVAEAFTQFIQEHSNLTSRQLDFLGLLRDFVIEREHIEKRDLIQAPFTVIHPQGIRGVFSAQEIEEILALTESVAA